MANEWELATPHQVISRFSCITYLMSAITDRDVQLFIYLFFFLTVDVIYSVFLWCEIESKLFDCQNQCYSCVFISCSNIDFLYKACSSALMTGTASLRNLEQVLLGDTSDQICLSSSWALSAIMWQKRLKCMKDGLRDEWQTYLCEHFWLQRTRVHCCYQMT